MSIVIARFHIQYSGGVLEGATVAEQTNARWNPGRLIETLAYFGVIPFVGNLNWLQELFRGSSSRKMDNPTLVLVVGATGGVGKRVVKRLQDQGIKVRALVRDIPRAKAMLDPQVELVEGDITLPETLTSLVTHDIAAVICCTGTKVQPVEGDTPTREKYYQGIKFYLPEVVDVPEIVEYQGIQNLVNAVKDPLLKSLEKSLFDFTKPSQDLKELWGALDDVVMGGASESSIRLIDKTAWFGGNVSTANSGGFASVRTRNFDQPFDLAGFSGLELRVKGDGKRYKFIIRSESVWDGVGYCYSFDTVYNIWMTIRIPFDHLIPVFRAKTVKDSPGLDKGRIRSIQLMLSKFEYDGALNPKFSAGLFQLQVESIKAYRLQPLPQFVMISSAGVTRPGKPGLNLEEEPPAVRMNDQLGGILTWKLKGEECVRASGIPYTIIRPCAMTEEAGGKALVFDQGDTIKGKVSREDIAQLCVQILTQPHACKMTFEVKESEAIRTPGDELASLATLNPD